MKIARQTETELVFEESAVWFGALFAAVSLFLGIAVVSRGKPVGLIAAGVLFLCSIGGLHRSRFVFDAVQRVVRWSRMRYGRTTSGSLPFDEISDVAMQSEVAPSGMTLYRLALVANGRAVPFCDVYSSGAAHYTALREAALSMLGPRSQRVNSSRTDSDVLDASIRCLLQQGRTVDAIELVRISDHLTLSAARLRVLEVRQGMIAGSAR